jgi:hypothetical protein
MGPAGGDPGQIASPASAPPRSCLPAPPLLRLSTGLHEAPHVARRWGRGGRRCRPPPPPPPPWRLDPGTQVLSPGPRPPTSAPRSGRGGGAEVAAPPLLPSGRPSSARALPRRSCAPRRRLLLLYRCAACPQGDGALPRLRLACLGRGLCACELLRRNRDQPHLRAPPRDATGRRGGAGVGGGEEREREWRWKGRRWGK